MYLLIIFLILGAIIGYFNGNSGWPFKWDSFIASIFFTMLLYGFVFVMGRSIYIKNHDFNTYEYRDLPIESLANRDGWSVTGGFILGTGGVSGGSYNYYVTYGRFSQGLKRMELDTDSYYLKETDSKNPCIPNYWKIESRKPFKSKWWGNRKYSKEPFMRRNYDAKTIIVPKNTVFKHFEIRD